jgi:Uma2 family endonuclease
MATITRPPVAPSPALVPYRLHVDQYDAMVAAGILTKRDRLELIEGLLVTKMGKGPKHEAASGLCGRAIERVIPPGWHVRKEAPVRIPDHDEPEPDLSLVRGDFRDYVGHHPSPADVALIVEVADTTLAEDRTVKGRIYARARIPSYWIINVKGRVGSIEVYTRPTRTRGYRNHVDYRVGQEVPVTIDGREVGRIAVADLLP